MKTYDILIDTTLRFYRVCLVSPIHHMFNKKASINESFIKRMMFACLKKVDLFLNVSRENLSPISFN